MAEEQEGQDITCQDTFDAPSSPTPANEVPINTSGEATAQEVNDAFLAEGDHLPDKVNKNSDPAEGAPAEGAPAEGDPAEGESRDVCKGDSTKIESTAETIPEKHSCPSGSTGENPSGTEADPKAATLPTLASGEEEEVDGPKVGISENSPAIKDTNNEAEEGESYPSEDSQTAELLDPDESNASASEEETKAPVVKKLDGQTSCVETIGPTITEASESAFSEADGTHGGSKRVLVVVGIVVLIAILVQHLLQPESVPPKNELQPIDLFLEQMEKVKTQYPSQRAELWKRSRLHLKRHLQTSHPTEPVSLILTAGLGAERTLNCLSQSLAFAFSSALSTSVLHIDGASKARQDSDQVKLDIDNQENIISKLLGDYDKVKALSEGSDCRCKCVVRPLSRSPTEQDSYSVETISSGPDCKCACVAPRSAVNPCEGEFRLHKLREAGKENVKLSTILELLEGSFYGMDLLKLHSLTSKLLKRVDRIEKAVFLNHSVEEVMPQESPPIQAEVTESPLTSLPRQHQDKRRLEEVGRAADDQNPEKHEEKLTGDNPPVLQAEVSVQATEVRPRATLKSKANKEDSQLPKTGDNGMIIRGMTFYKSKPDPMVADDEQPGDNSPVRPTFITNATTPQDETNPTHASSSALPRVTSIPALTSTSAEAATNTKQVAQVKHKYRVSWEEEKVEDELLNMSEPMQRQEESTSGKPEDCKDTLASISEPVTQNTYGGMEGAWMKDPKSADDKIYVTDFYYGNNLLEFRSLEVFKQGRFTNSYKLPYNWIGTGHVVYDGAFYYNRAFSRDIIKFDLRHRVVAAWTMLHDALFEESSSPWEWRSHSDVDLAVDESGLWIIYPALDDEGFLQEAVILSRLDPTDLSMKKETTWRTGLRRNYFGNCFIVCGVLYAVDSYNRRDANLEYAFDTHTNTQMSPRMPFINNYTYVTQIDYNPKEGVLYAWDNGHQVTYDIKFAYVEL
ncbi:olfactomedin-like 2Ba [Nematolebias whitei]|uniref:olfactomedin-like 2Ba n=1 Tax=Nematolebias whitei TaxID=451745 RepID=UPI0018992E38|nr:olfactomedin-like 2Ba [Nematolebias whitei]